MERAWPLSFVLIVLMVLVVACARLVPTPTPFQTAFPSARDCPGFEKEREIILRTIQEPRPIGLYESVCSTNGFSASQSLPSGHTYGISITAYSTEEEAKAELGAPNSTFRNLPAVHGFEARDSVVIESFAWRSSSWVFRTRRSDDTSIGPSRVHTDSERVYDTAVELGLFTDLPPPSDSPIEFLMKDQYAFGEAIEIRIRNNGNASYSYTWYPGCLALRFYGPHVPIRILANGHCDVIFTEEIRPGEEVVLGTWNQKECKSFDERYNCRQFCQVQPGRYGVFEGFSTNGQKRIAPAEWTFVIAGADGEDNLPTVGPGRPPPSGNCGKAFLEISVDGDALQFDTDRIEVAAGSEVALVFDNGSAVNQHNWVLVEPGTKDAVAQRGIGAGPQNGWVQPGDPDVVAHIKLLYPGETGEVNFTAPAVGTSQFVCTFPGHNITMFGTFVAMP